MEGAEGRLEQGDLLLHRQVHPSWSDGNRTTVDAFVPSSQAWTPTPKDEGMLSVSQGFDEASAEEAYNLFTRQVDKDGKRLESVGVWSVTVEECEKVGLSAFDDPCDIQVIDDESGEIVEEHDDAHAFIDYRDVPSQNAIKARARKLKRIANKRGPSYLPPRDRGPLQLSLLP